MFMRYNPFKGFGIALATPFREDSSIDFDALKLLIADVLKNGADFLCVLGTTAETPTLSEREKGEIMRFVVEQVDGRVPLLLGVGGNNTAAVCNALKSGDFSGFQGILSVCPFYNKPSQEGLYQHFKAISEACPLPVVLYNVPGRTGCNLLPQTTLRIANDCANVVAIKEASGFISQASEILSALPEGFEVISGDDGITFEMLASGAAGVISVIGNAFPKAFGEMTHSTLGGNIAAGREWHRKLRRLYPLMGVEGNPAGVKCLLSAQGKIQNILRLPLVPVSEKTERLISEFNSAFQN